MPTIEISDAIFQRLQAFATPLVDSVETALAKVLALAEQGQPPTAVAPSKSPAGPAPDLTHTTLKSARVNGVDLPPALCNWNALMLHVIELTAKQLPQGTSLPDLIVVNHVSGQKDDNGYKFIKAAHVSVQGQNANNAWKAIAHIAKATGIKVEATFVWAEHPKAARPGSVGALIA